MAALSIPLGTLVIAASAVGVSARNGRAAAEANAFAAVIKELELEQNHSKGQDLAIKALEDQVVGLHKAVLDCEQGRKKDKEAHKSELLELYRKINEIEPK